MVEYTRFWSCAGPASVRICTGLSAKERVYKERTNAAHRKTDFILRAVGTQWSYIIICFLEIRTPLYTHIHSTARGIFKIPWRRLVHYEQHVSFLIAFACEWKIYDFFFAFHGLLYILDLYNICVCVS